MFQVGAKSPDDPSMEHLTEIRPDYVTAFATTALVMFGQVVNGFLTLTMLHLKVFYSPRWIPWLRGVSYVVSVVVAGSLMAKIIMTSQAFGKWGVRLEDKAETQWGFGQLLAMLLLVLPGISALEICQSKTPFPLQNYTESVSGD